MTCKHCGASNDTGARFCQACGQQMPAGGAEPELKPIFTAPDSGAACNAAPKAGRSIRGLLHNRLAKWVAVVLAALLIAGGAIAIAAVPDDEDRIVQRLNAFAASYNEGDLDSMIECLPPEDQKAMEAAMQMGSILGSGLLGADLDVRDIIGSVMGFSQAVPGLQTTMYIKIYEIKITSESNASVDIAMCYGEIEDRGAIKMKKIDGDWYISD